MLPTMARGDPRPSVSHHNRLRVHPKPGRDPGSGDPCFGTHPQGRKRPHAYPTNEVKSHHPRGFLREGFKQLSDPVGHPIYNKTSLRDGPPSPGAGTPTRRGPPQYSRHMSTSHLGHCLALNPHNPDGIRPGDRLSRSRGHCPIGKCNTFRGHNQGMSPAPISLVGRITVATRVLKPPSGVLTP